MPVPGKNCLTVEESSPLSKYGRLRKRYLREHKRVLYYTLLTSGKLYEHLAEIDTSARDRAEYLIKEMARKQGVKQKELKGKGYAPAGAGKMNNVRACADERLY
ncbi:MAG: TnpV protein [Lachnospiraceae bacterium]